VPDRYGKWFSGNIFRHDYATPGALRPTAGRTTLRRRSFWEYQGLRTALTEKSPDIST